MELFTPEKPKGQRQERVAQAVRCHIATLLAQGDIPYTPDTPTSLVTVEHVKMSPDLKKATVYITCFGDDNGQALVFMKAHKGYFRKSIGATLKLRYTPDLEFKKP